MPPLCLPAVVFGEVACLGSLAERQDQIREIWHYWKYRSGLKRRAPLSPISRESRPAVLTAETNNSSEGTSFEPAHEAAANSTEFMSGESVHPRGVTTASRNPEPSARYVLHRAIEGDAVVEDVHHGNQWRVTDPHHAPDGYATPAPVPKRRKCPPPGSKTEVNVSCGSIFRVHCKLKASVKTLEEKIDDMRLASVQHDEACLDSVHHDNCTVLESHQQASLQSFSKPYRNVLCAFGDICSVALVEDSLRSHEHSHWPRRVSHVQGDKVLRVLSHIDNKRSQATSQVEAADNGSSVETPEKVSFRERLSVEEIASKSSSGRGSVCLDDREDTTDKILQSLVTIHTRRASCRAEVTGTASSAVDEKNSSRAAGQADNATTLKCPEDQTTDKIMQSLVTIHTRRASCRAEVAGTASSTADEKSSSRAARQADDVTAAKCPDDQTTDKIMQSLVAIHTRRASCRAESAGPASLGTDRKSSSQAARRVDCLTAPNCPKSGSVRTQVFHKATPKIDDCEHAADNVLQSLTIIQKRQGCRDTDTAGAACSTANARVEADAGKQPSLQTAVISPTCSRTVGQYATDEVSAKSLSPKNSVKVAVDKERNASVSQTQLKDTDAHVSQLQDELAQLCSERSASKESRDEASTVKDSLEETNARVMGLHGELLKLVRDEAVDSELKAALCEELKSLLELLQLPQTHDEIADKRKDDKAWQQVSLSSEATTASRSEAIGADKENLIWPTVCEELQQKLEVMETTYQAQHRQLAHEQDLVKFWSDEAAVQTAVCEDLQKKLVEIKSENIASCETLQQKISEMNAKVESLINELAQEQYAHRIARDDLKIAEEVNLARAQANEKLQQKLERMSASIEPLKRTVFGFHKDVDKATTGAGRAKEEAELEYMSEEAWENAEAEEAAAEVAAETRRKQRRKRGAYTLAWERIQRENDAEDEPAVKVNANVGTATESNLITDSHLNIALEKYQKTRNNKQKYQDRRLIKHEQSLLSLDSLDIPLESLVGTKVKISGLVNRPELNEVLGKLESISNSGRLAIRVPGHQKPYLLMPKNVFQYLQSPRPRRT